RHSASLAQRVAHSRSAAPGKTARANSSGISRKWPTTDIANPTRDRRWRRRRKADEEEARFFAAGRGAKADGRKGDTAMTDLSRAGLAKETTPRACARWAPVYDLVFGAFFERGPPAAVAAAERIGGRILEVGVGTGISLPDYARTNRLCGVDISE